MPNRTSFLTLALAALLILTGGWLRFATNTAFRTIGFDEILYRANVQALDLVGIGGYDEVVETYVARQKQEGISAELPPTRFLYVFSGWLWKNTVYGHSATAEPSRTREEAFLADPIILSLRGVSALFSTLLLGLSGVMAWRWGGLAAGLSVLALMTFAPLQIHTSQHCMIDGFFAFWAMLCLWLLWENLQQPNRPGWLVALGGGLICMILTKENAFFVFMGLLGLVGLSRWGGFGKATPALLATLLVGAFLGMVILTNLAGGLENTFATYILLVRKAETLDYAIRTGDGPWYRYLLDLLIMSPLILVLALGGAFCLTGENRRYLFVLGFIAATYLIMCNVRYGMNLRYATIWDLPLRFLAYGQLVWLATRFQWTSRLVLPAAIAALCAYDLSQYHLFFMNQKLPLYELSPSGLMSAIQVLKD